MTLAVAVLDVALPRLTANAPEGAEFPGSDGLLAAIALIHLAALPVAVWAVAGDSGLTTAERGAVLAAAGLWFGQVAHPAAHELIHRGDRRLFALGAAIYTTLLFGHHTSAHRLVHHVHAATRADPSTARAGEGFWRFAARAWRGSWVQGRRAEDARRARAGRQGVHPYTLWTGGALAALACGAALAGWGGVLVWLALAAHAQVQILLADYVQHYGLTRATRPDGRPEPVGPRHSWNAPHRASGAMTLNAPRHSDHHAHPARPYPALRLPPEEEAPRLPHALPVCAVVALVPPLWRRMMAPHLARWRAAPPLSQP
jgi:alkane 1-monooxygenase